MPTCLHLRERVLFSFDTLKKIVRHTHTHTHTHTQSQQAHTDKSIGSSDNLHERQPAEGVCDSSVCVPCVCDFTSGVCECGGCVCDRKEGVCVCVEVVCVCVNRINIVRNKSKGKGIMVLHEDIIKEYFWQKYPHVLNL
eukprot:GHVR01127569.1.p2 GENE.GHVR01127569.1~~GHVR01127569.1.p2  ORF type:complete len:139 (+),score=73.66 GHVR01127569.1:639-1055(+)